ncbi:MAG: hypothetical protein WCF84_02990 [Anaerolineae bacterium]
MADESENKPDTITFTRRQAITALGAGIVTLGATNLGTAYVAGQWGQGQTHQELTDLQAEVDKLRGLVQLYESLDQIGVDAIMATAMLVFKGFLDTLRNGVSLLKTGATAAGNAIAAFHNTFGAIRDGLGLAEQAVSAVASLLKDAETWLGQATTPLQPLLQQVRQFFDDLMSKIPFGVGDNIRKAVDGLVGLVAAIPNMLLQVNTNLIEPLRTGWFSADNSKNLQGTLVDPITRQVMDPLAKFLGDVDETLFHWESDVATPVQTALNSRAVVRSKIGDYKKQHNLS